MKKISALFIGVALMTLANATAYGPEGHAFVGAIADARLAGTPTGVRVTSLLNGMTLAEVAVIPDQIKGWDRHGPNTPGGFYLPNHPKIEDQLRAFCLANPPSKTPRSQDDTDPALSLHWFHGTDIPLVGQGHYREGKRGRSQWDLVH